MVYLRDMW